VAVGASVGETVGVGVGVAMGVAVGVGLNGGVGRGSGVGCGLGVGLHLPVHGVGVGVGVGVGPGVYSSALATGKIKQQPAPGTPSDQEGARSGVDRKRSIAATFSCCNKDHAVGQQGVRVKHSVLCLGCP
jgi:hypothetical protein